MTFRDWLAGEMEKRQLSRREIARRLAAQHPKGVNVDTTETYRRAIRRYLEVDPQVPTEQTQRAIAAAIGADPSELPSGEDDEEDDLALMLQASAALAREQAALQKRMERAFERTAQ